jgi:hypothetical protein
VTGPDAVLLAAVASADRAEAHAAYRKSVRDWREANEAWQRAHALYVIGELICWAVSGAVESGDLTARDAESVPGMNGRWVTLRAGAASREASRPASTGTRR